MVGPPGVKNHETFFFQISIFLVKIFNLGFELIEKPQKNKSEKLNIGFYQLLKQSAQKLHFLKNRYFLRSGVQANLYGVIFAKRPQAKF